MPCYSHLYLVSFRNFGAEVNVSETFPASINRDAVKVRSLIRFNLAVLAKATFTLNRTLKAVVVEGKKLFVK
jgi:hypothetical protein